MPEVNREIELQNQRDSENIEDRVTGGADIRDVDAGDDINRANSAAAAAMDRADMDRPLAMSM